MGNKYESRKLKHRNYVQILVLISTISACTVSSDSCDDLEGTITHQRDYFDLGQLLYEQMPILGFIVRAVRKKFAAN